MNGLHARAALIVQGWRAGSDRIMSNTGGDHGTQKRQTSEAISQKTQSATPHALLRSADFTQPHKRMIMDYHITESAHGIHLDVVSTVPEGDNPER
jgi:hypothetical protein